MSAADDLPTTLPLAVAAGLRSSSPIAALVLSGRIGAGRGRPLALAAVAGELLGDKLPGAPARTSAPGLASRASSGALTGLLVGGPAAAGLAAVVAAASGAAGATVRAAFARRGTPDLPVALAEDALALALASFGAARAARRDGSLPVG